MNIFQKIIRYFDLNSTPDQKIKYVDGDATAPIGEGNKLIIHCCNDVGAWGAGFVLALSSKDTTPEEEYKAWCRLVDSPNYPSFHLGAVQLVKFTEEKGLYVVNMIGQHGCGHDEDGNPPIRYEAIRQCLKKVRKLAKRQKATVHAPRFGSDLAGGDWNVIEKIIEEELTTRGIPVTVYDWKG
jgi:O-acetyl-ADP-ribose deacetylase (regulator of RNase III)